MDDAIERDGRDGGDRTSISSTASTAATTSGTTTTACPRDRETDRARARGSIDG